MKRSLQYLSCLLFASSLTLGSAQAQVINFENTWLEFLSESKTSNVTKLPRPPKESQEFLKFALMYANSHFCADEMAKATEFMDEIKAIGPAKYNEIPGFKERFLDLDTKMAAYPKLDKAWKMFLSSRNVPNLSEHEAARAVCEKGMLSKYFYMEATRLYCGGNIEDSRKMFESRIITLTEKTNYNAAKVDGLPKEIKMMKDLYAGIDKLNPAWAQFVSTDKSPGFDISLPVIECYPIPNIKEYLLRAAVDPCKYGNEMLAKIKALQSKYTGQTPSDVSDKITWLEKEVGSSQEDAALVEKAWKEFLPKDKLTNKYEFTFDYPCNRDAQIKAYTMVGLTDVCTKGEEMLNNINKTKKEFNPTLDATTQEKIKKLETAVKTEKENLTTLNKAWAEFTPNNTLPSKTKFVYEYCDKVAQIRAYTITGVVEFCAKGKEMMANIKKTKSEHNPTLDPVTEAKIAHLQELIDQSDAELANLNEVWAKFIANKDTLTEEFVLADFYCDKIAQTKSWVIKGRLKACPTYKEAQPFVTKIDDLKKEYSLKYDKELDCAVTRLRQAIWDCRYEEAVAQAKRETHEEREAFGPKSAQNMQAALNSDKQPCQTTVAYEALNHIGIKYTINTFLCEKTNLAKMGDPEYYKKIATWVDTEVLQKYCLANMRCKKDFFIYLEGHTDGNPFNGRSYSESINIPKGTPFTHFVNGTVTEKTVAADITTALKGNMDLGLARAWTVRQQLTFMNVPITIGAYEHPSAERGGEYRKVEIQLNITNLLLDFYEKRLDELVKPLGARPTDCK